MQNTLSGKKVIVALKHIGAQYDDRLRKVCETLAKGGAKCSVYSNERDNKRKITQAYGNFPLQTIWLLSCMLIKGDGPLSRAVISVEFSLRIIFHCLKHRPDWILITDPLLFFAVPVLSLLKKFGVIEGIAWDQRELPPSYIAEKKWFKPLFAYCCRFADSIISVNQERSEKLSQWYGVSDSNTYFLPNYNDESFALNSARALPEKIADWLESKPYVLLQSSMVRGRHFINTLKALDKLGGYKAIIVGRKEQPLHEQAQSELQDYYLNHCLHVGYVDTAELSMYYDNAAFSLIFYQSNTANNTLCDPNRLYQSIARGLPVVVGNNPPMKRIVSQLDVGTICETDGQSWQDILSHCQLLLQNYAHYRSQAKSNRQALDWENVENALLEAVGK